MKNNILHRRSFLLNKAKRNKKSTRVKLVRSSTYCSIRRITPILPFSVIHAAGIYFSIPMVSKPIRFGPTIFSLGCWMTSTAVMSGECSGNLSSTPTDWIKFRTRTNSPNPFPPTSMTKPRKEITFGFEMHCLRRTTTTEPKGGSGTSRLWCLTSDWKREVGTSSGNVHCRGRGSVEVSWSSSETYVPRIGWDLILVRSLGSS